MNNNKFILLLLLIMIIVVSVVSVTALAADFSVSNDSSKDTIKTNTINITSDKDYGVDTNSTNDEREDTESIHTNSTITKNDKTNSTKSNSTDAQEIILDNTKKDPPKIQYIVRIDVGEMKFEYSYGPVWNPYTHSYSGNSEGWNMEYLQDEGVNGKEPNNRIKVTNLSIFPVKALFEYHDDGLFGEAPEGKYNVDGIFMKDNEELRSRVRANDIDPASSSYTTAEMTLEAETQYLQKGTTYYYKNYNDVDGKNEDNMFFSLMGTPAREQQNNTFEEAGRITVTITPETDVHVATKE